MSEPWFTSEIVDANRKADEEHSRVRRGRKRAAAVLRFLVFRCDSKGRVIKTYGKFATMKAAQEQVETVQRAVDENGDDRHPFAEMRIALC